MWLPRVLRDTIGYLRGERPPDPPDRVTWRVTVPREHAQAHIRTTMTVEGWETYAIADEYRFGKDEVTIRYRRTDGKYRWRDEGFEGF